MQTTTTLLLLHLPPAMTSELRDRTLQEATRFLFGVTETWFSVERQAGKQAQAEDWLVFQKVTFPQLLQTLTVAAAAAAARILPAKEGSRGPVGGGGRCGCGCCCRHQEGLLLCIGACMFSPMQQSHFPNQPAFHPFGGSGSARGFHLGFLLGGPFGGGGEHGHAHTHTHTEA